MATRIFGFSALGFALVLGACSSQDPPAGGGAGSAGKGGRGGNAGSTGGSAGGSATGGAGGVPQGGQGGTGGGAGGASGPVAGSAGIPEADASGGGAVADTNVQLDVGSGDGGGTGDTAVMVGAACPAGPFEAPKVGPRRDICGGFRVKYNWNEGPTWVASQKAFFFSNFVVSAAGPGDMIKYDPVTDKCEVFIEGNGCNGLTVDRDGNLLGACHTPRALLKYDLATKKSTVLVDMADGRKLDSPNDVVTHRNGTIYFSNATFELAGRPAGLGPALLRVDPAGLVHVVARGGINPLGLSPDQKRL